MIIKIKRRLPRFLASQELYSILLHIILKCFQENIRQNSVMCAIVCSNAPQSQLRSLKLFPYFNRKEEWHERSQLRFALLHSIEHHLNECFYCCTKLKYSAIPKQFFIQTRPNKHNSKTKFFRLYNLLNWTIHEKKKYPYGLNIQ